MRHVDLAFAQSIIGCTNRYSGAVAMSVSPSNPKPHPRRTKLKPK
jgi:hypothetical protein